MEGIDLLFPFKIWIGVVAGTTIFSFLGTWVVIAKSKLLK